MFMVEKSMETSTHNCFDLAKVGSMVPSLSRFCTQLLYPTNYLDNIEKMCPSEIVEIVRLSPISWPSLHLES
jgi:hypothetical protein